MQKMNDIFDIISSYLEEMDRSHWKRSRKVSAKSNNYADKKRKSYSKKLDSFKKKIVEANDPKEKEFLEVMLRQYILRRRKNS